MKKNIIIIVHWLIIALVYTSFLWADWKLVICGVLLYWLQIIIAGACVLTIAQFGNKETTFWGYYINKVLKRFNRQLSLRQQQIFLWWILPPIIIILSIIVQVVFGHQPLILI